MNEILVLAEHLDGQLRDITDEMLAKARELADGGGASVVAVLFGAGVSDLACHLAAQADEVLVRDHDGFAHFNSAVYQPVLAQIVKERNPALVMIGHTALGVDLAPSLAVALGLPLATDCVDVTLDGSELTATRQTYGGKIVEKVGFRGSQSAMVTLRPAAFPAEEASRGGKIVELNTDVPDEPEFRKFVEYVEAAAGDVDITKSEIVIAVGRGIKEEENMPIIQELADMLGGVLACSRPVVDAGCRQRRSSRSTRMRRRRSSPRRTTASWATSSRSCPPSRRRSRSSGPRGRHRL